MGASKEKIHNKIDRNLILLKIIIFLVFSALAIIHVLNAVHPISLGLNFEEFRIISIVVPFISILGPLIAGPLADKLAARNANNFGTALRIITAIYLILAAIFYACLLAIPKVERFEVRQPSVSFGCDSEGGVIFQEKCSAENTCFTWDKAKHGSLILTNCSYTCQNPNKFQNLYIPWGKGLSSPGLSDNLTSDSEYLDDNYSGRATADPDLLDEGPIPDKVKRSVSNDTPQATPPQVNPPHLCLKDEIAGVKRVKRCHVYTEDSTSLTVQATLRSATMKENDSYAEWCHYPLEGFQCTIPELQTTYMKIVTNASECKPMVVCQVIDPYNSPGSVLAESQCITLIGSVDTTLWGYLVLRFIAEIFPLGAITLLNTAIIVATRETSTGRGEICRQLVWGSIGWIIFFPKINLLGSDLKVYYEYILPAYIVAVVLLVLAAIILLLAKNIPLSPPEWWWHTKTGVIVYPMSAVRKYGPEIFGLTIITIVLGTFWSIIHSYLPWTYIDYYAITVIGLLPVLFLLFNIDKFIDYCGHSNILIGAFAVYIIRFTALSIAEEAQWLTIVLETFEPLTLGLTWITIILYMRHIVPRKFTATGQAVAVIAHFCLGKGIGALIALVIEDKKPANMNYIYKGLAIVACIISVIYFVLYHTFLAPKCAAKSQPAPATLNQSQQPNGNGAPTNGANGNYTPLRVYHNERGKKGQFRY